MRDAVVARVSVQGVDERLRPNGDYDSFVELGLLGLDKALALLDKLYDTASTGYPGEVLESEDFCPVNMVFEGSGGTFSVSLMPGGEVVLVLMTSSGGFYEAVVEGLEKARAAVRKYVYGVPDPAAPELRPG